MNKPFVFMKFSGTNENFEGFEKFCVTKLSAFTFTLVGYLRNISRALHAPLTMLLKEF